MAGTPYFYPLQGKWVEHPNICQSGVIIINSTTHHQPTVLAVKTKAASSMGGSFCGPYLSNLLLKTCDLLN